MGPGMRAPVGRRDRRLGLCEHAATLLRSSLLKNGPAQLFAGLCRRGVVLVRNGEIARADRPSLVPRSCVPEGGASLCVDWRQVGDYNAMMSSAVQLKIDDAVARVTLARPESRNALGPELISELFSALERVDADPQVRAVVLTGEGSAFSAGADLRAMREMADATPGRNRRDAREMGSLFHRIGSFSRPVVARVAGPAIGGGVGLMAACDVVVAADSAFFAFSEVRLGIVPAVISPFCVRRLGPAVAARLFMTARRIAATDALRYGLVDEVVPHDALDSAVDTVVADLLAAGPNALREVRGLVEMVSSIPLEEALDRTAELIARLRATDEAREGMNAFLNKTRPSWERKR